MRPVISGTKWQRMLPATKRLVADIDEALRIAYLEVHQIKGSPFAGDWSVGPTRTPGPRVWVVTAGEGYRSGPPWQIGVRWVMAGFPLNKAIFIDPRPACAVALVDEMFRSLGLEACRRNASESTTSAR